MRAIAFFLSTLCLLLSVADSENSVRASNQQGVPAPATVSHRHYQYHYQSPRSYSALHYWMPRIYVFRAYVHPVQYRQYLWPQSSLTPYNETAPPPAPAMTHPQGFQERSPVPIQRDQEMR